MEQNIETVAIYWDFENLHANRPEMKRKKNPKPVGLGIKDLIVAMDQGGVKHCQRGTLKQRDHSKND